ncbi:hypothetical protein PEX2_038760 [Penicillium expansum]|uniref:Transcription factor, fungi n=1 Tax=Penicillium expansum TaxID=27334 RepID=A0A0A2JI73_PENEN|nr:hypothetical protein PEX2_038760 [Penicillium expansum]KGO45884.1 hypothetical protein PEXP_017640 [Penicillium expansum]KGO54388.1 hypothetical protein PEX2_038760 [Penicillium expansum]
MQAILKSYLPGDDLTPETLHSLAQQCRHQKTATPQPNPFSIATQPVAPSTPISVSAFGVPSPRENTLKTPDENFQESSDPEPNPEDTVLQDAVCFHQKLGCLLADSLGEYRYMGPESGLSFNAAIRRLTGDEMYTPESPDVIPGMVTVAMPLPSPRSQQNIMGLPPLEECQTSIMRYFEEVHCLYWLFSSDRFHIQLEKTYQTPLENLSASWLGSLYSILAIVYVETNGLDGHTTATEYLEHAKSYVPAVCDEGTLDSVRAMVILILPLGSHTPPDYLAACSSLSQLAKTARNHVYNRPFLSGQRLEMKVITKAMSSLQEWADALPPHLRISDMIAPRLFCRPIAILHLRYHGVRLLITRPFLLYDVICQKTMYGRGKLQALEPLSALCVSSAENMLSILVEMVAEGTFSRLVALDFLFALDVLQVLLSAFALSKGDKELANVRKCLQVIQAIGTAGYGEKMISEVIFELVQWGMIPNNSAPSHSEQSGEISVTGFDALNDTYNFLFGTSDTTIDLSSFPMFSGLDLPIQMGADLTRLEYETSLH